MSILNNVRGIKHRLPFPIQSVLERFENSPLGRRLAHGAFWTLVGTFASRGLNMGAMVFLARILGKESFGEVGIIQSSLTMFQTLAGFGLGWAATKYVAEYKKTNPVKTGRIIAFVNLAAIGTGGLISAVFFFAAPWLAKNTLAAPHLARTLQLSSLILFFGALAGSQNGSLIGFEAFRSIARINLVSGIINLCSIVIGGFYWGVEGAVWGILIGQISNWSMKYYKLRIEVSKRGLFVTRRGCWREKEILWKFGLPAILGGVFFQAGSWSAAALLVNQPRGYAEMGFYNAANQWFSALVFLPAVLGQAVIPALSEHISLKKVTKVRKIMMASMKFNSFIIFPFVLFGSLASKWIMGFYGNDFEEAWGTLVLTLCSAGIVALQAPAAQIISSSGKMWVAAVMNISWAIVFVLFSYALIDWGSLGLASSRVVAYIVYAFWSMQFSFSFIKK